jgi:nucleotide-binding universal stress UspA family protein
MTIVCGTDFSEPSSRAVAAAAHLAARTKMPLHLVHTLEVASDDDTDGPTQIFRDRAIERLRREAGRLREVAGSVEIHVEAGLPDDALLAVASRVQAKLIVIGVAGRRHGKTALGGHADRIAQRSHVPVLVIRDVAPFEQWALGSKPLRVVLGSDTSTSSETAMRWINELRGFGPCDVTAVHLYWPPEQFHRLGLGGVRSYLDPDPEVTRTLERELGERFSHLPGAGPVRYRLEPHLGRVADRVAEIAAEEAADLVVVGSHSRSAVERLWEGSISRGLLQCARSSAACVPLPANGQTQVVPVMRDVLVATDFSSIGDGAIPFAYATAARGGTVHLIHVVRAASDPVAPHDIFPPEPSGPKKAAFDAARKQLLERVPAEASAKGVTTRVHVLQSIDPAGAICQAAERLAVELVCLGTHGRTGVAKVVLGSVVQEVLSQSRRPVLVTRAPLE